MTTRNVASRAPRQHTNALETEPGAIQSLRNASVVAGVALLVMAALAGFGKFAALDGLVTEGDAAKTARDIIGSEAMFRLGIVSLILVVALDVVIAWALYRVFSPVNRNLSMLAAVLRLVYAGVFMVAIGELLRALRLLGNDDYLRVFTADQLHAQALLGINAFTDLWYVGQFLFGLHLLVIGYLAWRSGYVPRWLGALLAIAGLGYAIDSVGATLSQTSWTPISSYTFLGEFLLAVWLVARGRRLAPSESDTASDSALTAR
jgi:Domain of unknown function (DUF4386)